MSSCDVLAAGGFRGNDTPEENSDGQAVGPLSYRGQKDHDAFHAFPSWTTKSDFEVVKPLRFKAEKE
jgi:hypothetical protein